MGVSGYRSIYGHDCFDLLLISKARYVMAVDELLMRHCYIISYHIISFRIISFRIIFNITKLLQTQITS